MSDLVDVAKALRDDSWKNISEFQADARRARRRKANSDVMTGLGLIGTGAALPKSKWRYTNNLFGVAPVNTRAKIATGLAGATGLSIINSSHAKASERHAERRITARRRERARKTTDGVEKSQRGDGSWDPITSRQFSDADRKRLRTRLEQAKWLRARGEKPMPVGRQDPAVKILEENTERLFSRRGRFTGAALGGAAATVDRDSEYGRGLSERTGKGRRKQDMRTGRRIAMKTVTGPFDPEAGVFPTKRGLVAYRGEQGALASTPEGRRTLASHEGRHWATDSEARRGRTRKPFRLAQIMADPLKIAREEARADAGQMSDDAKRAKAGKKVPTGPTSASGYPMASSWTGSDEKFKLQRELTGNMGTPRERARVNYEAKQRTPDKVAAEYRRMRLKLKKPITADETEFRTAMEGKPKALSAAPSKPAPGARQPRKTSAPLWTAPQSPTPGPSTSAAPGSTSGRRRGFRRFIRRVGSRGRV